MTKQKAKGRRVLPAEIRRAVLPFEYQWDKGHGTMLIRTEAEREAVLQALKVLKREPPKPKQRKRQ